MNAAGNLIQITLIALREHPDDWVFTQYAAKNAKLDIEVWIANGLPCLRINGPGVFTNQNGRFFIGWAIPWRRRVMQAVREAANRDLLRRFAKEYPEDARKSGLIASSPLPVSTQEVGT